ncbi:MAG: class I SAM-dependent methyltransferase [Vicinamibacterales bacterium]
MKRSLVAVCVLSIGMCGFVLGRSADAQTERQQRHRVPADYMSFLGAQWLERAGRVAEEQPAEVLAAMGLEPGDVVADVGCGSGYYARRIARRVQPGGRVYCVDIQPEMLEIMQQRAAAEDVTGVEPILSTATDPRLAAGAIDWIIIADVYHEMSDPEPMLARMRESLAPGGQIALLEYRVEDGTGDHVKADHTMSVRQVLSEWHAAGFELVRLHDFLPGQHLFFFRAADAAGAEANTVDDHDLLEAIDSGLVQAEAVGAGADSVTVRIRRTGTEAIVVTSPVAAYFKSDGDRRDMIARRDGWIVLADDDWHEWSLRAVGRQRDRGAPAGGDRLEILPPDTVPRLEELFYQIQVGTYTVADSPVLYPPRTYEIEQAAVWIADADAGYRTLERGVEDPRVPPQYAVAFALVFCDLAGIDITDLQVWRDREAVFGVVRDQGLNAWYQVKTAGQVTR